jgi:hypothetical protein
MRQTSWRQVERERWEELAQRVPREAPGLELAVHLLDYSPERVEEMLTYWTRPALQASRREVLAQAKLVLEYAPWLDRAVLEGVLPLDQAYAEACRVRDETPAREQGMTTHELPIHDAEGQQP